LVDYGTKTKLVYFKKQTKTMILGKDSCFLRY